ncbi:hypothetical protein ABEF79_04775 [Acinetobacter sp. ANC 7454]|uniref:hypothetical protein n=1 Tax=Acinetobacter thermotolerans TaxID=3151487 RepID=UPI00325A74F1
MTSKRLNMKKILQASLVASTLALVGCATPLIAPDIIANVKKVDSPYLQNASSVQVSINPKINNREKIDVKVKDSLELALKNSNLFGTNTQQPYKITAEVLVASQAAVSFGNFEGKLGIKYTVFDDKGVQIFQDTINTVAGSDLNPLSPAVARHTRSRARNIALNVNEFVEKLETVLRK